MLFSSLIFLTLALPIIWGGSLVLPKRWQNGWLLLVSLLVYAWGGVSYTSVLLGSILLNYLVGLQLQGAQKRLWLVIGIGANLATLAVFKYTVFAVGEANELLRMISIPAFELPKIALPLGISFYTFQAMSYLVDTYRGTTVPQRNIFRLGLYISFFPQLIAGPIVRYQDMDEQIRARQRSWEMTAEGIRRFLIGLAKKVLIANTLATVADEIFALDFGTMDAFTAWAGALLYAGQIYYDFSGYSDMAIGLGMLFGFRLPENFNYPYTSKSIREFWRRWHITLGAWFRDYLYVPLGGSRNGYWRTMRNLLLVFLATGFWHGAAWAFVLWGLWHGLFIVLERQKWWPGGNVIYAFVVVLLGWVLFRTESAALAGSYYLAMFGLNGETVAFDWGFYWNLELTVVGLVAVGLGVPWGEVLGRWGINVDVPPHQTSRSENTSGIMVDIPPTEEKHLARTSGIMVDIPPIGEKHSDNTMGITVDVPPAGEKHPATTKSKNPQISHLISLSHLILLLTLFLLSLNALVNNALNPFIYFRF